MGVINLWLATPLSKIRRSSHISLKKKVLIELGGTLKTTNRAIFQSQCDRNVQKILEASIFSK
jgi:hypothetical protein